MPKKPIFIITCAALLLGTLIWALPTTAQIAPPAVNLGNLRLVNALVGLGPVDVYLDGERIAFSVSPEQATPYFAIPAGKHNLAVRPVKAASYTAPIADILVDLSPNQSQSAIVYQKQFATRADPQNNLPAFEPPYEQSGAIVLTDDDRSPIQLGKTRLTAVHLAMGTPHHLSITFPSRESLLHRIGLEQPYGSVDVKAGIYRLTIVDADSPNLDVAAREGEQNFDGSTLYTLVIVPDIQPVQGDTPYQVGPLSSQPRLFVISAPIDPPAQGIRLRVIHAAGNADVFDVYIDERLVAQRVYWSRITEYLGLDDYSHTVSLRRYGSSPDSPPLARAEFNITSENRQQVNWTLLFLNAPADTSGALPAIQPGLATPGAARSSAQSPIIQTRGSSIIMTLLPDNISQTQRDFARVRLINAVAGVPALRLMTPNLPQPALGLGTATPTPTPTPRPDALPPAPVQMTESTLFGAEASEAEVPTGLYNALNVVPISSTAPLYSLPDVQLVGGMVYTFVVMGSPSGAPPIQVALLADYGTGLPLQRLYLGKITAIGLANIRTRPSATAGIVAKLPTNAEVEVLGRNPSGEWIRIRFTNPDTNVTQEGWIAATVNIITITRLGVPVNALTLPLYVAPG